MNTQTDTDIFWDLPEETLQEKLRVVYQPRRALQEQPRAVREPRRLSHLRTPFYLALCVASVWALTLNNSIFIDEAVYIRGGNAYLNHWFHGAALDPAVAAGFSGSPVLYPVLAAALDAVGGLWLVRLFSLACMLATIVVVRSITTYLFSARAGLMAAVVFSFTSSVIYIGHLGTFDALVVLMLATSCYLGLTRTTYTSALLLGLLLALAVGTKYTAYVFVPSVLAISLFGQYATSHVSSMRVWLSRGFTDRHRLLRAGLAGLVAVGLIVAAYVRLSDTTEASLKFTTTDRKALSPAPVSYLVGQIPQHIWLIGLAAIVGLLFLVHAKRYSAVLLAVGLLLTALLLPVGQMILGEAVSFEKHLAYSALFLAPIAGWGLARPWKLALWAPVLTFIAVIAMMWGAFRSHDLIQYPNVKPVVATLKQAEPGLYLSSSSESLRYYTQDKPDVNWVATYNVYGGSTSEIDSDIQGGRYQAVILYEGKTGSTIQDVTQAALLAALGKSTGYEQTSPAGSEWLVFKKTRR